MNKKDIGLGCIAATLWGLNFIAIKVGLEGVPPLLLVTCRFLVVSIPAIFFFPRPPVAWPRLIALGLTINAGQFALLFVGIALGMPAGLASLILQAQAFFTLIFAVIIIGEMWRRHHLIGLVIATAGMALIGSQQGGTMTAAGFWFTLAASACWGAGNVIMRRATRGVPAFPAISLVVWSCAIAILPVALLSLWLEGFASWQATLSSVTLTTAGSLIYLGYFASLGGYGLWGKLLSRYPAAVVSPFALLVPVVGMSSAALLLGELFSLWQISGAVLVMAGLAVNVFGGKIKKEDGLKVPA